MRLKILLIIAICMLLQSCYQASNDDADLRTVPTTNNPNNLTHKPAFPGMPL